MVDGIGNGCRVMVMGGLLIVRGALRECLRQFGANENYSSPGV